jgi:hypothetical protein
MVIRGLWLIALTAGAGLLLAASARADDLQDLKLGRATGFTHNDRAPVAGDIEDINFRYWLGYWRDSNNIGYIARFNAFRTGHADGSASVNGSSSSGAAQVLADSHSSGGLNYVGGQNYGTAPNYGDTPGVTPAQPSSPPPARLPMPSRRPGTLPGEFLPMPDALPPQPGEPTPKRNSAPAPSYGHAARHAVSMDPCCCGTTQPTYAAAGQHAAQNRPVPSRMPMPARRPGSAPSDIQPLVPNGQAAEQSLPPARMPMPARRPSPPTQDFRPMPEPTLPNEPVPKPSNGTPPRFDSSGSRLVSDEAPGKKLHYPAYGEHLRSSSDGDTLYANQKK